MANRIEAESGFGKDANRHVQKIAPRIIGKSPVTWSGQYHRFQDLATFLVLRQGGGVEAFWRLDLLGLQTHHLPTRERGRSEKSQIAL